MVTLPFSDSYRVHMPVSTASLQISIVSEVSARHPVGHGVKIWMYLKPLIALAFSNLLIKSWIWPMEAVATYGTLCAIMICGMSFLKLDFPALTLPTGVVVVHAPKGVDPDLCIPVFM